MNGLQKLAQVLDARGQYDLADRIDRVAGLFGDEIDEGAHGGFDPERPPFRGYPRNKLPKPRFGLPRDGIFPGQSPWPVADEIMGDNTASEFETTLDHPHSPNPRIEMHDPIDEGEIWEDVMAAMSEEFPGIGGDSTEEMISRLVHAQYRTLSGDSGETDAPMEYDPEILQRARSDVAAWIGDKFEQIERGRQENL